MHETNTIYWELANHEAVHAVQDSAQRNVHVFGHSIFVEQVIVGEWRETTQTQRKRKLSISWIQTKSSSFCLETSFALMKQQNISIHEHQSVFYFINPSLTGALDILTLADMNRRQLTKHPRHWTTHPGVYFFFTKHCKISVQICMGLSSAIAPRCLSPNFTKTQKITVEKWMGLSSGISLIPLFQKHRPIVPESMFEASEDQRHWTTHPGVYFFFTKHCQITVQICMELSSAIAPRRLSPNFTKTLKITAK